MLPTIPSFQVSEYGRFHLLLKSKDGKPIRTGDPDFVDILLETIERLENEDEGGWKSVGVKVEEDSEGYCGSNVRMKRPKSVPSKQVRRGASTERRAA